MKWNIARIFLSFLVFEVYIVIKFYVGECYLYSTFDLIISKSGNNKVLKKSFGIPHMRYALFLGYIIESVCYLWQVGVVDPFIDNPENGSCCLRQYNFSDYFQFNASEYQDWNITEEVPEITGYVDTVYLRYTERALYFFKNEYVYKADIGPVRRNKVWGDPGPVKLHFMGKWNTMWYDLCDVHTTILDYCSVSNLYIRH